MTPPQELRDLPLDMIEPNLSQPRRHFDEERLKALAGSLKERGVLQPVLVRSLRDGKYELIVGERRWRAARIAGLQSIPALVSRYDNAAALEVALIENMAREDLNPVEEARACAMLVMELGLTAGEIADRVGRSRSGVANLMRLLNLSEETLEMIERGELGISHGLALLMVEDLEVRSQLARKAVQEGWTAVEARAHASRNKSTGDLDNAVPAGAQGPRKQGHEEGVTAMNVARVWGDALGAEVQVRTLSNRRLRVELVFDSPEEALALGGHTAEAIARGSKRR